MKLTSLLLYVFLGYILVLPAAFTINEPAIDFMNMATLLLALLICLALIAFVFLAKEHSNGLLLWFIIKTFIAYLLTFLMICFIPNQTLWFRDIVAHFSANDFNWALLIVLLSTIATGFGLFLGGILRSNRFLNGTNQLNRVKSNYSMVRLDLLFFLICIINLTGYYIFGLGRYTNDTSGYAQKFINSLIYPPDTIFLLYFVLVSRFRVIDQRRSVARLMAAVITFYLTLVLTGSKGGTYFIILIWLFYKLSTEGDFKVDIKKALRYVIPIILLSIVSLYAGYYIKWTTRMMSVETGERTISVNDVIDGIEAKEALDPETAAIMPFRRMALLEQALVTSNMSIDNKLLNWKNTLLSSFDRIVPGTFFPDVIISERIYSIYARGYSVYEQTATIRENAEWSLYGLMYVYNGLITGLLLLFMLSLILSLMYNYMLSLNSGFTLVIKVWFLSMFEHLYSGFGIDSTVSYYIPYLLQIFIYILIVRKHHVEYDVLRSRPVDVAHHSGAAV